VHDRSILEKYPYDGEIVGMWYTRDPEYCHKYVLADLPTGTYHARLDYLKALYVIVNHCKSLNVILILI